MSIPRKKGKKKCAEGFLGVLAPSPCPHVTQWEEETGALGPSQGGREQNNTSNDIVSCTYSVSFHRNHTVTVRSQVENATASHVENEYSQPPRNSQISAYPGKHRLALLGMTPGPNRGPRGCPEGEGRPSGVEDQTAPLTAGNGR